MNAVTPLLTIQIHNTRVKSRQLATCRKDSALTGAASTPRANHQKGFHSRTTP